MKAYLARLGSALLVLASSPAHAANLLHFSISGGYSASFDIDADQLPSYYNSTSTEFDNVTGSFTGVNQAGGTKAASATTASQVQFYSASYGGGIGITADPLLRFVADGAQLYAAYSTTAHPTFVLNTYALTPEYGYAASMLTISQAATAAVPEPATWTMMLVGFGVAGAAVRQRRDAAVRDA